MQYFSNILLAALSSAFRSRTRRCRWFDHSNMPHQSGAVECSCVMEISVVSVYRHMLLFISGQRMRQKGNASPLQLLTHEAWLPAFMSSRPGTFVFSMSLALQAENLRSTVQRDVLFEPDAASQVAEGVELKYPSIVFLINDWIKKFVPTHISLGLLRFYHPCHSVSDSRPIRADICII